MKSRFFLLYALLVLCIVACSKSSKEVIEDTKAATVTISMYDEYGSPLGTGSGFFIDENGTGITNYHVLDKAVKAMVRLQDGKEYEIDSVLASDKKMDLIKFSIRHLDTEKFHFLTFAKKEPEQGDKVYNVGTPMGWELTASEGIVSALRQDTKSGRSEIQITAPISSGCSGSAIVNAKGEVLAVATYVMKVGQNLNFGVRLNKEILASVMQNDFDKKNRKFHQKDNYVILNVPEAKDQNMRLNAIEFRKDATIAYFSCTNLNLAKTSGAHIYAAVNKKDEGFYILDHEDNKKYYLTSSSLGDENNSTIVPFVSTVHFTVTFPGLKNIDNLSTIDIVEGAKGGWRFEDIDVAGARAHIQYDELSYMKNLAYAWLHEGETEYAESIFLDILDDDPEDEDALNTLAIIALVKEEEKQALQYFEEAIDCHPNSVLAYKNRAQYYYYSTEEYDKALSDWNKVIGIAGDDIDNYYGRAFTYYYLERYNEARQDFNKVLEADQYRDNAFMLYMRARCSVGLGDRRSANEDLRNAYRLSRDTELDDLITNLYNAI